MHDSLLSTIACINEAGTEQTWSISNDRQLYVCKGLTLAEWLICVNPKKQTNKKSKKETVFLKKKAKKIRVHKMVKDDK